MASKRYYWIKIKESFLTSDTVDFFMSLKDGANYVVMYQMLALKAINTNGKLARMIGDVFIPFDVDKIQRDLKFFNIDTIRVGLELFLKLDLIKVDPDGAYSINNFSNLIGSESESAGRVRKHRKALQCNENVTHNVPPLNNINYNNPPKETRDKILDIRDKDINIDKNDKEDKDNLLQNCASCKPNLLSKKLIKENFIDNDPFEILKYNVIFEEINNQGLFINLKTFLRALTYTLAQYNDNVLDKYSWLRTSLFNNLQKLKEAEDQQEEEKDYSDVDLDELMRKLLE